MKLKLKKNSSIRKNGLYDLESIFGDCAGHGCGFGAEDISWYIRYRKEAKSYKRVEVIYEDAGEIELSFVLVFDDLDKEDQPLDWTKLPQSWSNKIKEMIKTHCLNSSKIITKLGI